jgi:hypothetical protein
MSVLGLASPWDAFSLPKKANCVVRRLSSEMPFLFVRHEG